MSHSEFADLQTKDGMTLKEVGSMYNALVRKLKGGAALVALVSCLSSFVLSSPAALGPDTEFGDISPNEKLKAVVEASGAISGVDTNAVIDIIHKTVDGAARPLPRYLHALDFSDSYTNDAAVYYRSRGDGKVDGGCSSVRNGGFLSRNFDYPFDERAEFVVRMSASTKRFASVGVAQVGTNLTEQIVTSGKPEYSHLYKWLPGATLDGINEHGVACNINVVDGPPQWRSGVSPLQALHPLAAVRWILDNATNAQHAAEYIASHIAFPPGWTQNYHYMIADESSTYIVENGEAYPVPPPSSAAGASAALTNFRLYPTPSDGEGQERYIALTNGANITSQWWTLTYTPTGYRPSDLPGITGQSLTDLFSYWASKPREAHRGETFGGEPWWQSVHTSVYDITNRVLRVAVQEVDDWYVFQVPSSGGVKPEAVREIVTPMIRDATNAVAVEVVAPSTDESARGKAADANDTGVMLGSLNDWRSTWFRIIGPRYYFIGDAQFADYASGLENAEYGKKLVYINKVETGEIGWGVADASDILLVEAVPFALRSDISGKLDAPAASSVTNGHVAMFDIEGGEVKVKDGGSLPQDYAAVSNAAMNARSKTDLDVYETGRVAFTLQNGETILMYRVSNPGMEGYYVFNDMDPGWDGTTPPPNGSYYTGEYEYDPPSVQVTHCRVFPDIESAGTGVRNASADEIVKVHGNYLAKLSDLPKIDHTDTTFSNEVLRVQIASLSTNITAEVYIAATNACANLGIDPALIPQGGTLGTVGGLLLALAAAVALLRKKTKLLKSDGTAEDDFATDLLGKPVAINALKIPLEAKADSFVAEDGHAYAVTMTDTVTITMPTVTEGKAAIFQARFSAAAQQSVQFSTDAVIKFDGADCGVVKAGKDALLSAMWNGEAWDLVWKNEA